MNVSPSAAPSAAHPPFTKLRNLALLAGALLLAMELARLAFVWQFGSLNQLLTPVGLNTLYLGLKFDLRLIAIMFAAPWLLLQVGQAQPKRPVLGAALLIAAILCYFCLVLIGMVDDRAGRYWLLAFFAFAALNRFAFRDYGIDSGVAVRRIWAGYAIVTIGFVLVAYATDFGSFSFNRIRLNGTILGFLSNPLISAQMIWQTYPVVRGALVFALLAAVLVWGLRRLRGWGPTHVARRPRWLAQVPVAFVLVACLWGKQSAYPLRWGEAFDGRDRFLAQTALNPVLQFLETRITHETGIDMDAVNATHQALADYFGIPKRYDANGKPSLLRTIAPRPLVTGTPNVVFIQVEGLSAYKTSMLGNKLNPTPFMKELAAKSLYFDRFYVVMENTGRSIFATLFGIPDVSSVEWTASRNPLIVDQNTLVNQLEGYDKFYFLGGSANWAQIRASFANNIPGLKIFEEGSYKAPIVDVWGVADVDMLREGGERLLGAKRPFFAYFQTSGDHPPFTIPKHLTDFQTVDFPKPELTAAGFVGPEEYNSVRLMDYSLRKFFEAQARSPDYLNTVYVLWADHGIGRGNTDPRYPGVPLFIHQIPAMIFAPGFIKEGRVISTIGSQMDILPTVLSMLGRASQTQTLGKDILDPRYATSAGAFTFSAWQRPPVFGFIQEQNYFVQNPDGRHGLYDLRERPEKDHTAEQPQKAQELSQLAHGFHAWARYLMENNKPLKLGSGQP